MKSLRSPGSSRAFTLIELLTVIAIIGILAAILIPTVGAVRAKAQGSKTVSNLRQIQAANNAYAAENRGFFMGTGSSYASGAWNPGWFADRGFLSHLSVNGQWNNHNGVANVELGNAWDADYPEILKTGRMVPSSRAGSDRNFTIAVNATTATHVLNGGSWRRAMNWWDAGSWTVSRSQVDLIANPSMFITYFESSSHLGSYFDRLSWNDDIEGTGTQGMAFRNGGYCNVVFADGHVGRFNRAEMTPDNETTQRYFFWRGYQ